MKQLFIIKLLKSSRINMKRRLRTSKRKGDHVFCHVFVDFIVFKQ